MACSRPPGELPAVPDLVAGFVRKREALDKLEVRHCRRVSVCGIAHKLDFVGLRPTVLRRSLILPLARRQGSAGEAA